MMGRKKKRSMFPVARHPIVPQTMATTTTLIERKMPPFEILPCYTPNYFITTILTIKIYAAVSLRSILNRRFHPTMITRTMKHPKSPERSMPK
jgi:hypothetical protein